MSRTRRRLLIAVLVLLVLAVGGVVAVVLLGRATPGWYRSADLTAAETAALDRSVHDKLSALQNAVGQTVVDGERGRPSAGTIEVELTDDELNVLYDKWKNHPATRAVRQHLAEPPRVRLTDGRITLAGRLRDPDSVVSVVVRVGEADDGRPTVKLEGVMAGLLPVPGATVDRARNAAKNAVADATGLPPTVAQAAIGFLDGQAVPPVVLVGSSTLGDDFDDFVPARVEKLAVADGVLKATLRPIPRDTPADVAPPNE